MIPRLNGFRVINQTEGHTCGLCSMIAIYKYYKLSIEEFCLRERLGVDNNMLPSCLRTLPKKLIKKFGEIDLTGTLPPDVLSVLHEDGFDVACKFTSYESYRSDLLRHLKAGHPALALVEGIVHWVVVVGMDDEGLSIADSSGYLDPTGRGRRSYTITHDCAGEKFSGMILVSRGKRARAREMTAIDFVDRHVAGAAFGIASAALYGLRAFERWLKQ